MGKKSREKRTGRSEPASSEELEIHREQSSDIRFGTNIRFGPPTPIDIYTEERRLEKKTGRFNIVTQVWPTEHGDFYADTPEEVIACCKDLEELCPADSEIDFWILDMEDDDDGGSYLPDFEDKWTKTR